MVDFGTASGTEMPNIHRLKWDDLALELTGIIEDMLPELTEGAKVLDYASMPKVGLGKVAIVSGSFDGALQNIGYGVYERDAVLNLGSTAVIRVLRREAVWVETPG